MAQRINRTPIERPECHWCAKGGAPVHLQQVAPGSPAFLKDPGLDGIILCASCRYDLLTGRI